MFNSLSDTIILDLDTTTPGFVFGVYMNEMDQIPCSNSITVCESSSGSVPEAVIVVSGLKGETSDSLSNHVLMEDQKENDSRMGKDGVTRVMLQKKQRRRSFT